MLYSFCVSNACRRATNYRGSALARPEKESQPAHCKVNLKVFPSHFRLPSSPTISKSSYSLLTILQMSQSMSSETTLRGSCRCASTRYTVTAAPLARKDCHCTTCRKLSGSAYMPMICVDNTALTFSGAPLTKLTSDLAVRVFCGGCHTQMGMRYFCGQGWTAIPAGTVDQGEVPASDGHIFVGEKAAWYELPEDGLERCEGFSPTFQKTLDSWEATGKPKDLAW